MSKLKHYMAMIAEAAETLASDPNADSLELAEQLLATDTKSRAYAIENFGRNYIEKVKLDIETWTEA